MGMGMEEILGETYDMVGFLLVGGTRYCMGVG
jgi:hypothetical protein